MTHTISSGLQPVLERAEFEVVCCEDTAQGLAGTERGCDCVTTRCHINGVQLIRARLYDPVFVPYCTPSRARIAAPPPPRCGIGLAWRALYFSFAGWSARVRASQYSRAAVCSGSASAFSPRYTREMPRTTRRSGNSPASSAKKISPTLALR